MRLGPEVPRDRAVAFWRERGVESQWSPLENRGGNVFLAQDLAPYDAARLGVYLHGMAGDHAAAQIGPLGLAATDLLATLPQALRELERIRDQRSAHRRPAPYETPAR